MRQAPYTAALAWLGIAAAVLPLPGCGRCENPRPVPIERYDEDLGAYVEEELEPPGPDAPRPPAIADRPAPAGGHIEEPTIVPASHADRDWASDEPVNARRYVYRIRMSVATGLGVGSDTVTLPAAELFVDISHERLRARFVGTGWPVSAGSEVRLRRDRPGVYLFDEEGGRPLEPGELARWYDGGRVTRRGPPLRIFSTYGFPRRAQPADDEEIPGELMCALLAEWAGEPRDRQLGRCELGAPRLFRIGFWRGEQTAGVPVDLPRRALRADEAGAPPPMARESSRAFLEPAALARIRPDSARQTPPGPDDPAEGLAVRNETQNRVIVAVEGVTLGWVDAGATARFVGLREGTYDLGSVRPLGAVVQRSRPVDVPGLHRVCDGRCPRQPSASSSAE